MEISQKTPDAAQPPVTRPVETGRSIRFNALAAKQMSGASEEPIHSGQAGCGSQGAHPLRALQSKGHVLGFMGDGINDAPALKATDVDISVDSTVDIAK